MHTTLQQVNAALSVSSIQSVSPTAFAGDLADSLDALPGVSLSTDMKAFVQTWPSALQAAVRAAITDNLSRAASQRVPVVLSWTPGYDYDVRIWDIRNTDSSHGELTIHLTSRYPGDPHPLGLAPADIDL